MAELCVIGWRAFVVGVLLIAASSAAGAVPGSNGVLAFTDLAGVSVVSPAGGGATTISDGFSPSWSPDGNKLVFARRLPGPCAPCNFELVVVDRMTGRETKIFEGATFDPAPSWSPDGRTIAFVHQLSGFDDIWLVGVDGTMPRRLTFSRNNHAPAWSPDGQLIAFDGFDESLGRSQEIFAVRPDGSGERALTNDAAFDAQPSWSPDGTTLTFASDRGGRRSLEFDVYAMSADGSAIRRLTTFAQLCAGGDSCFVAYLGTAWSPDGTQIAFTSHRDGGGPALYVMGVDGSGQRRVTGSGYAPDWQPTVELSLSMSGPARPRVGRAASYTLSVNNASPRTASGVVVTVNVARDAKALAARTSHGTCTVGRAVVCRLGDLPTAQPASLSVRIRISRRGKFTHVASVRGAEADPAVGNNRRAVRTTAR